MSKASDRGLSRLGFGQQAALRTRITSRLPPLEQRVRQRELATVVRDALAQGDASPAGFLKLASEYGGRCMTRRLTLEQLRAAYAAATTPKDRTAVITRALRQEQAPYRAITACRRGWLDLDAMAERAELNLHALLLQESLALRAAAALAEDASAASVVVPTLLDRLLAAPPPLATVAAAEALLDLLVRLRLLRSGRSEPGSPEADTRWTRLCERLRDASLPRRSQAALLRLCWRAAPALAYEPVLVRLLGTEPGDDFLVRQHIVVLLGQRAGDAQAFGLLAAKTQCGDASEHVRVALPTALRASGGAAAVRWLEQLAGVDAAGTRGDESPRVRAAATIALAGLLRTREADTFVSLQRLFQDSDPLVYQTAAEELAELALHNRLSETEAAALRPVVARRAAQAPTTQLAEPALRTQEALATITSGALSIAAPSPSPARCTRGSSASCGPAKPCGCPRPSSR
jgi:hypothetical protein